MGGPHGSKRVKEILKIDREITTMRDKIDGLMSATKGATQAMQAKLKLAKNVKRRWQCGKRCN